MQSICENEPPSVPNKRKPNLKYGKIKYRGVEQMVARRAHNPEVAGSSPVPATKKPQFPVWETEVFLVMRKYIEPATEGFPGQQRRTRPVDETVRRCWRSGL